MDANPAPGAVPAVNNIEKALAAGNESAKPADPVEAPSKAPAPALETSATPADATTKPEESTVNAPKPVSVEDAPDKDAPSVTTGIETAKPISDATKPPAADEPAVAQNGAAAVDEKPGSNTQAADGDDKLVTDKPAAVNGSGEAKDVQMTGAIDGPATTNDTKEPAVPAPAPATIEEDKAAAPAIASEEKPQEKTTTDKKRKADKLDANDDPVPTTAADGLETAAPEEPPKKKKVGRPPSKPNGNANGDANGDEGLGHKLAKKVKQVLPAGRTERKTRSQGPA